MSNINAMAPEPTAEVPATETYDMEKHPSGIQDDAREITSDTKVDESDANSAHKQDGVKRVEAITTVWSKDMLIAMFVL